MRKEKLANLNGSIDLGTLEALVKRRFRTYPKLEIEKVYFTVTDYFLDKCNEYDLTHTNPEEVQKAYNDTKAYLKKLKFEMDGEKESLKNILDKFKCDED
jgi:hypothetical protein